MLSSLGAVYLILSENRASPKAEVDLQASQPSPNAAGVGRNDFLMMRPPLPVRVRRVVGIAIDLLTRSRNIGAEGRAAWEMVG